jgi:hypothetical protein
MGTLQSFDRMTYRYSYTTDSGQIIKCDVTGGVYRITHNVDSVLTEDEINDAKEYALEQWHKARAGYLEEAQEQELADRIARSRKEA